MYNRKTPSDQAKRRQDEYTTKQFQILTDIQLAWDFFVEIYDREKGGGVAAPFFEYALQSSDGYNLSVFGPFLAG